MPTQVSLAKYRAAKRKLMRAVDRKQKAADKLHSAKTAKAREKASAVYWQRVAELHDAQALFDKGLGL